MISIKRFFQQILFFLQFLSNNISKTKSLRNTHTHIHQLLAVTESTRRVSNFYCILKIATRFRFLCSLVLAEKLQQWAFFAFSLALGLLYIFQFLTMLRTDVRHTRTCWGVFVCVLFTCSFTYVFVLFSGVRLVINVVLFWFFLYDFYLL